MLRRHLQKMHRPYEYFTFRNDSVSRTLDLAKYVVGPYQSKLFLKNLVQKYVVGHPNLPRGYKNHTCGFWVRPQRCARLIFCLTQFNKQPCNTTCRPLRFRTHEIRQEVEGEMGGEK